MCQSSLRKAIDSNRGSAFAAIYGDWIVGNFMFDGNLEAAATEGERWLQEWKGRRVRGELLATSIYRALGAAYMGLGSPSEAIRCTKRWIKHTGGEANEMDAWYRLAEIAHEIGDTGEARRAYERVHAADGPLAEAAGQALERMGGFWLRRTPLELATELVASLREGNRGRLSGLASRACFSVGRPGGERQTADRQMVLDGLARDLSASRVYADPGQITGMGQKRYLVTKGWDGTVFTGQVHMLLFQGLDGLWEWGGAAPYVWLPETAAFMEAAIESARGSSGGVATVPVPEEVGPASVAGMRVSATADDPAGVFETGTVTPIVDDDIGVARLPLPADAETLEQHLQEIGNELDVWIKAPWPDGLSFQAGGLGVYLSTLGNFVFTGFGWTALLGFAQRPCGFGMGGHYYNSPSHNDHGGLTALGSQFAVDFLRYEQGNPFFANKSKDVLVLACTDGIIDAIVEDRRTGDARQPNRVNQRLLYKAGGPLRYSDLPPQDSDVARAVPPRPTVAAARIAPYTARYLHLDGRFKLTVARNMLVRTGWAMGRIDDTGLSVYDHLHFAVYDHRIGGDEDPAGMSRFEAFGRSIRLSPIDGTWLGDLDEGICVTSSNHVVSPPVGSAVWDSAREYERGADDVVGGVACPLRMTPCRDACVDLGSDPRNCGVCGQNCGVRDDGTTVDCVAGECAF